MKKSTDRYQQFERQFEEVEWLATHGAQATIERLEALDDSERAQRVSIMREFVSTLGAEYLRLEREWGQARKFASVRVACANTLHFPPQS